MAFIGKQPPKAAITSSDITDGVVTAAKLASDSVTTAKIADNGVTTAKINADAVTDAKIADDVVGSEHLTAGEVDTTALGADAVTAAKIADDAISEEHLDATVITGMTELAAEPADTDEFLISDAGTLKRIDYSHFKASPGMTLLTSADITSTTSSIVIDSTYINDTHEHYMLILRGKDAGDGIQMNMRYRNDAGNSTITSNYAYRIGGVAENGGGTNSDGTNLIRLSYNHPGSGANEGFNLVLHFLSPRSNLVPTSCQWNLSSANTSDEFRADHGMARRNDGTEKHGGFVIFFSNGGDFANGTNYELYGFKK